MNDSLEGCEESGHLCTSSFQTLFNISPSAQRMFHPPPLNSCVQAYICFCEEQPFQVLIFKSTHFRPCQCRVQFGSLSLYYSSVKDI
jgi:hypothetical protein